MLRPACRVLFLTRAVVRQRKQVPFFFRQFCAPPETEQRKVTLLLANLLQNRRYSRAYKKIDEVKRQNLQLDHTLYNQILQIYAQNGDQKRLLQTCAEMEAAQFKPDIHSYNALLSFYGRAKQIDQLYQTREGLLSSGLQIPIRTYNILLHAYILNNQYDKATDLFVSIAQSPDLALNIVTFTEMMNLFIAKLEHGEIEFDDAVARCRQLLDDAKQRGLSLDTHIYNKFLQLHSKKIFDGDTTPVLTVYKEIKTSGLTMNVDTYNILLQMYSNLHSLKGIESTMTSMQFNSVKPNLQSFRIIMQPYIQAANLQGVQKWLKELKKHEITPDMALYTQLIQVYAAKGQIKEARHSTTEQLSHVQATHALSAMKKIGTISADTQKQVFMLLASVGSMQAVQLFHTMQKEGFALDIQMFNEVLRVCSVHQKVKDALLIYEDLKFSLTVTPDVQSFTTLLSIFCATFELEMIGSLLTDMVSKFKIFPSIKIQELIYTMNEDSPELRPEAKQQVQELKQQLRKKVQQWPKNDPNKQIIKKKTLAAAAAAAATPAPIKKKNKKNKK